ncbi:hypothetical protein E3N88_26628 [Mikania micrantha]|uniref:Uncharacterized protein n=1 Tax=Mikania micrantha TaxID=192012 RepID=A0A5N6MVD5_9ASTR|nr:hypothetical protein E3N88_26628 [Mikania micrantha]
MEFQHFLSKSPDAHCNAKSCTGSSGPCTTVHNFARPCNQAVSAQSKAVPGQMEIVPAMTTCARPCLTPRVNFRDLAENGNFDNRPRPKVKYCSTLHDRVKFQNFYKFSFSPHLKELDFLELRYLLFRFLKAIQGRL